MNPTKTQAIEKQKTQRTRPPAAAGRISESLRAAPGAGQLAIGAMKSTLGDIAFALRGEHLLALGFERNEAALRELLARQFGDAPIADSGPAIERVQDALGRYFAGQLDALDGLLVDGQGTDFQRAVWSALREIPAGETRSYAQIAARLGKPRAVRAVGAANGRNPIWLVVPCHRVIGADGSLTGYAGGLARKRWLLEHERGVPQTMRLDAASLRALEPAEGLHARSRATGRQPALWPAR